MREVLCMHQSVRFQKERLIRLLVSRQYSVGWLNQKYHFATVLKFIEMESKEYFEKEMRGYNQNRNGRSYRKYCEDEAIDYNWVIKYNKK